MKIRKVEGQLSLTGSYALRKERQYSLPSSISFRSDVQHLARYRQIMLSVRDGSKISKPAQIPNSSLAVVPRPQVSVPTPMER